MGDTRAPRPSPRRGLSGLPTFLHEQNSVPGRQIAWRAASRRETLVTFPAAEERLQACRAGRDADQGGAIFGASREAALASLGLEPPVVLVFGGSGGALRINLAAEEAFGATTPYTVVQISGRRDFARLSTKTRGTASSSMWMTSGAYLAAADVVVSRAGAGSLFDIAAAGEGGDTNPVPLRDGGPPAPQRQLLHR